MRHILRYLLVAPLLFMCLGTAQAKDSALIARVDRNSLALGSFFNLYVTMRDVDGDLDISPLEQSPDFRIVSRNSSTSISIVNFEKHVEETLLLQIAPQRAGKLEIPSLGMDTGDKGPRTDPIAITVTEVGSAPQQQAPPNMPEGNDVYLEASASNPSPYVGEPLLYTLRVYLGRQINNPRLTRPEFPNFAATELPEGPRHNEVVNGRTYMVVEIKHMLTPLAPGKNVINPVNLQGELLIRGNSFFPRLQPFSVQSGAVEIETRALPEYKPVADAPPFQGLVGDFQVTTKVDKNNVSAGDSITLTVTVSGKGNLRDAADPGLHIPDSFKVYKDAPKEDITPGDSGYQGSKTFSFVLVPLDPGSYTLPPVGVTYFSPEQGRYLSAASTPVSLDVAPAKHGEATGSSEPTPSGTPRDKAQETAPQQAKTPAQQEVEFLHKDILPLKESLEAIEDTAPMGSAAFWLLLFAPVFGFGLIWLMIRLSNGEKPVSATQAELARQLLEQARKESDPAQTLGLCSRALVAAVNGRCNCAGAALTYSEARERLNCEGLDQETVDQAAGLLERLDSMRYGGAAAERSRNAALEETSTMIRRLRG